MTWVKVDDDMPWHRKFRKAGDLRALCLALDLTGMCHCAKYATDGFVSDGDLPGVLDVIPKARRQTVLKVLVEVGRWDRDEQAGGYWVRNYLKYNPSAAEAEKERQRRAENTRRWRAKHRGNQSHSDNNSSGNQSPPDSVTGEYLGPRAGDDGPSPLGLREPERQLSQPPPRDPSPSDAPPSPSPGGADSASDNPRRCRHRNDPATCGVCSTAVGTPPPTRLSATLRPTREAAP